MALTEIEGTNRGTPQVRNEPESDTAPTVFWSRDMIIKTPWFTMQGPRRADLSGRPFGFLFIPRGARPRADTRFARVNREFGFYLPPLRYLLGLDRREWLECVQLLEKDQYPRPMNDWRKWPEPQRGLCENAIARAVAEKPGHKIVADESFCDVREDLSDQPLQLYRAIALQKAA